MGTQYLLILDHISKIVEAEYIRSLYISYGHAICCIQVQMLQNEKMSSALGQMVVGIA